MLNIFKALSAEQQSTDKLALPFMLPCLFTYLIDVNN
jgi:hypothetical protein